ncbi:4Fe-4S binding domain-containing protein [Jeongeupia sp. HS-3]|uniref:4Fe-4S binding protein n=1 Tax=Jeongeupia sp. HS-3 TaxID=1009682 RepID=UPI0018A681A5|nr:4Fe-4S binding protein [Jeongeupia sp. HS-3]BCL77008.1 4Fe-4S binding domain-containing protein [Jeongeupia sp. HS-3]
MSAISLRIARFGDFLRDHKAVLRMLQWGVVAIYVFLIVVPVFLPLPDETAHVFNNLTVAAQFAFWGIWWPFVLVSMPLMGRAWCGWFCPEGMLSEWMSERGRNKPIPKWIRWGGWPFVAFAGTTIYGQLVSVYQYPLAVLLVLGGSTVAAIGVGFWYGRSKRIWCRYLCPVNGVFQLLSKLAPWRYKVDEQKWRDFAGSGKKIIPINCAPLVPLRHMQGAAECHMCGRCSGHRDAIALTARSPEEEIVDVAHGDAWQTVLIVFGMMGLALGAFLWSASPWLIAAKQWAAEWLIDRDILWPLNDNAPWWLLTHYPEMNDSFSWLDGAAILGFIFTTAIVVGGGLYLTLLLADRLLPQRDTNSVHRLAQALVPAAGCGVFLGLSATTVTLLKHEGLATWWVSDARFALLTLALAWSLRLAWRIAATRGAGLLRRLPALAVFAAGLVPFASAWWLFFAGW